MSMIRNSSGVRTISARRPAETPPETRAAALRQALLRRLPRRIGGTGQVRFPAIPALVDHYVESLQSIFTTLGRRFNTDEMTELRRILGEQLGEGFRQSPYARVVVRYETAAPPEVSLNYRIAVEVSTIADEYADWVSTRTPPLFGAHPDAKVMTLAQTLGAPATVPVLDVGAGTGRNTLPLARAGFPTDAVELAPSLAAILRDEVTKQGLAVRVFEGDALDPDLGVPTGHYRLVVLAEVIASHGRTVAQVRALLQRMTVLLAPGGVLLLSAFLTRGGYQPQPEVREGGEVFWSCLFTRNELFSATAGLELDLISDESVYDFERQHLPAESWPPTGWFTEWVKGLDVVDLPIGEVPFELRWLAYRRR
jgi:SAM-dependent methyltransferase